MNIIITGKTTKFFTIRFNNTHYYALEYGFVSRFTYRNVGEDECVVDVEKYPLAYECIQRNYRYTYGCIREFEHVQGLKNKYTKNFWERRIDSQLSVLKSTLEHLTYIMHVCDIPIPKENVIATLIENQKNLEQVIDRCKELVNELNNMMEAIINQSKE